MSKYFRDKFFNYILHIVIFFSIYKLYVYFVPYIDRIEEYSKVLSLCVFVFFIFCAIVYIFFIMSVVFSLIQAIYFEICNALNWGKNRLLGCNLDSFKSYAYKQGEKIRLQKEFEQQRNMERMRLGKIIDDYIQSGKIHGELSYAFGIKDGELDGHNYGIRQRYDAGYEEGKKDRRLSDLREQEAREKKKRQEKKRQEKAQGGLW